MTALIQKAPRLVFGPADTESKAWPRAAIALPGGLRNTVRASGHRRREVRLRLAIRFGEAAVTAPSPAAPARRPRC